MSTAKDIQNIEIMTTLYSITAIERTKQSMQHSLWTKKTNNNKKIELLLSLEVLSEQWTWCSDKSSCHWQEPLTLKDYMAMPGVRQTNK